MGKYRSKSGCLTCRSRRVKCDEVHPICGQCNKKSRTCQWGTPHTRFKGYQPSEASSSAGGGGGGGDDDDDDDSERMEVEDGVELEVARKSRSLSRTETRDGEISSRSLSSGVPHALDSPSVQDADLDADQDPEGSASGVSVFTLLHSHYPDDARYLDTPITLTRHEAFLVHHYTNHLGFWLDCNDASRQFTLRVPEKVKECPVLFYAVLSFAARHYRDTKTAEQAYQHCIALLIDRLNENAARHDEKVLSAIVILRFYEELNVSPATGSDDEQHLAGCSAILRASQGHQYVDPSAPTLREAAFWVYVRQCLYKATTHQQPPDIDFSLKLQPTPDTIRDHHPLAQLKLETAWANQMTWNCACVINFCFDRPEPVYRTQQWQELWDCVEIWGQERPNSFDPIWSGPSLDGSTFPEIWFTSDWHSVSFGFYHFSCIMLLCYKPGPKFPFRYVGGKLSDTDNQILQHVRAICGSCKSSPEKVPNLITLCHTIFIWGPLLSNPEERNEVIQILADFENYHVWPTTWIIKDLKNMWGLE